mmetsp:Transcript_63494/g.176625  ORF Transcript_63494/g.176625 Transcript_63494/m.176625 type:complete len:675 (+) Transcript_63494:222-2246(+)
MEIRSSLSGDVFFPHAGASCGDLRTHAALGPSRLQHAPAIPAAAQPCNVPQVLELGLTQVLAKAPEQRLAWLRTALPHVEVCRTSSTAVYDIVAHPRFPVGCQGNDVGMQMRALLLVTLQLFSAKQQRFLQALAEKFSGPAEAECRQVAAGGAGGVDGRLALLLAPAPAHPAPTPLPARSVLAPEPKPASLPTEPAAPSAQSRAKATNATALAVSAAVRSSAVDAEAVREWIAAQAAAAAERMATEPEEPPAPPVQPPPQMPQEPPPPPPPLLVASPADPSPSLFAEAPAQALVAFAPGAPNEEDPRPAVQFRLADRTGEASAAGDAKRRPVKKNAVAAALAAAAANAAKAAEAAKSANKAAAVTNTLVPASDVQDAMDGSRAATARSLQPVVGDSSATAAGDFLKATRADELCSPGRGRLWVPPSSRPDRDEQVPACDLAGQGKAKSRSHSRGARSRSHSRRCSRSRGSSSSHDRSHSRSRSRSHSRSRNKRAQDKKASQRASSQSQRREGKKHRRRSRSSSRCSRPSRSQSGSHCRKRGSIFTAATEGTAAAATQLGSSEFAAATGGKGIDAGIKHAELQAAQIAAAKRLQAVPMPWAAVRPGDWVCPICSCHNFSRQLRCFRCHRGQAPFANPDLPGGGIADFRAGDWVCARCSNHNFAKRGICNKCEMPR